MQIGFSLPTRYLAGDPTGAHDVNWQEMVDDPGRCLEVLAAEGVRWIELRDVRETTEADHVHAAAGLVQRHGLNVTVHLWLPRDAAVLPASFTAADEVVRANPHATERVPSAIHAHDYEAGDDRAAVLAATVVDLASMCALLGRARSRIGASLELCRSKGDGPVGVSVDELLRIADAVGDDTLGFCWDTGHGLSNHVIHGDELVPGPAFLARVSHTHIHDLDGEATTHAPVLDDAGRLAHQVLALAASGYGGIYNLELEPNRWASGPAERLAACVASVATLTRILERAPAPGSSAASAASAGSAASAAR